MANKNDLIILNIKDHRLCALGYPIVQKSMNDMLKNICKQVGIDSNGLNISMYTCRHMGSKVILQECLIRGQQVV